MASWKSAWLVAVMAAIVSILVLTSSAQQIHSNGRFGKQSEEAMMVPRDIRTNKQLFYSGSRYGRGGNNRRDGDLQVAPRTDRFYMGSRYGKRGATTEETGEEMSKVLTTADEDSKVTCLYTGVTNLYRCFDRKDNNVSEETTVRNN